MGSALCRVVVELGNGFEEVGMLNAIAWALACFGVVAADIALSVVLFSVLDAVSALTGYPIDNLDIQWFQAACRWSLAT